MRAGIRVKDVSKVFALAEHGGEAVSFKKALRAGKPEVKMRHVRALDCVSFEIAEGERVGIIGRNGAGKTTLLSIMAGLTEPTSGSVEVDGVVHAMLSIGTVLREDLTGRDNILLDAAVHGRRCEETVGVADEIIQFAELDEFIDRPVRTYSSGMKARLAFAMGAFIDPDVLINDETLSVGDAFFEAKATRRMQEVAASGRIVVVVSHGHYEVAVHKADEAEFMRKFGRSGDGVTLPQLLTGLQVIQDGQSRKARALAMVPATIVVQGRVDPGRRASDLAICLTRVDGRLVWR